MSTDDTDVIPVVSAEEAETRTGLWWWVSRIVSFLLLAAMLFILAVTVVIPRISGSTPYTVLTSSMRPTYPPGALVVVKPAEVDELVVGTAVTYQIRSGEADVVTHRIVATRQSGGGETTYVTRGDNNGADDEDPVQLGQIRGKVWYSVPYMGYVNNWLNGEQRKITVTVILIALAGYAVCMFAGAGIDHRKKRKEVLSL
ncbi:signal peptidase I [Rhodococcus sp. PAMC28707]|uniref:signal peptidase I n=1 Tax=unclassified Rhodococcus (in: high G+C Gram-positive bacteria) TaxID=192944 RepID=UPI00109E2BB4|nr:MULTISPECIES: signal peptidase I [unclassified Rhodococcus (in: high G+C Gram-positive bacteria)]QCB49038.1 signal peptidase I [Rhodococcus sp. PAMC28705]QCB59274.1 signal peptidase I [Rhodococcus sp. PAMC28707]